MLLRPTSSAAPVIEFSDVVASLSYALDITQNQPSGHSARTCLIGMRIGQELRLKEHELAALFYALLLKDLGCSSNSAKMCAIFGACDLETKGGVKTVDWTSKLESAKFVASHVAPGKSLVEKASRLFSIARSSDQLNRDLFQIRCDRGATIARNLQLPELTAEAILSLDEHWDGHGYPANLKGDEIPLLARIMGLSQTVEVFWQRDGMSAACDVARDRSGTWFDPDLVSVFLKLENDPALNLALIDPDPASLAAKFEPEALAIPLDSAALDRLALGFSQVIDAKSPWTYCHSTGVAEVAAGIGEVLGLAKPRLRTLRRAALLHDMGKLGVSNLILDKPGKLNPDELAQMRKHPQFTFNILSKIKIFNEFAPMSAAHHERLDGRGYHQGLSAEHLTLEAKILAVSDIYEALAAKRPYRKDLTQEDVFTIIAREDGIGLCSHVISALRTFIQTSQFVPFQVAA